MMKPHTHMLEEEELEKFTKSCRSKNISVSAGLRILIKHFNDNPKQELTM